jgi:hypothetical protein
MADCSCAVELQDEKNPEESRSGKAIKLSNGFI